MKKYWRRIARKINEAYDKFYKKLYKEKYYTTLSVPCKNWDETRFVYRQVENMLLRLHIRSTFYGPDNTLYIHYKKAGIRVRFYPLYNPWWNYKGEHNFIFGRDVIAIIDTMPDKKAFDMIFKKETATGVLEYLDFAFYMKEYQRAEEGAEKE